MNALYGIISLSAPLLLASAGALISEHSGCMALFLDGIINLAAFLCFAGTLLFHSAAAGIVFSVCSCTIFIFTAAVLVEKLRANRFLAALALNILTAALASVFSAIFFHTRGVLTNPFFVFPAAKIRLETTVMAFLLCAAGCLMLRYSRIGLYIRISGSDANVLRAKGIDVPAVRITAWIFAAAFGAVSGCILSLKISSFVPNIASGTGWTALAAVFLGKKNTAAIIAAVLVFAASQYGANNLQNAAIFKSIPPAFLLSLPYLSALLLILLVPKKQS